MPLLSAVKLKALHHKPRSNGWKGEASERSNYYLLCLCCFHGLFLCTDSKADFVHGCSHAERGEQEELSNTAGLYLLLLWLWFNHCRVTLYPDTLKQGRNVLAPFLLMDHKAKGVSVGHQLLNVRSSCRKPHLSILTCSAVISKWPPSRVRVQTSSTQVAGSRTWRDIHLSWWKVHCDLDLAFSLLWLARIRSKQSKACWLKTHDSLFAVTRGQNSKMQSDITWVGVVVAAVVVQLENKKKT